MHLAKLFSTSTMGLTQTSTLNLTMADLAVPAVVEVVGDAEVGAGVMVVAEEAVVVVVEMR